MKYWQLVYFLNFIRVEFEDKTRLGYIQNFSIKEPQKSNLSLSWVRTFNESSGC